MSVLHPSTTSLNFSIASIPLDPIWRLSVAQYHEMIRTGILTSDDQVELLEGWLIPKMPKNPPHRIVTKLTRNALEKIVPDGYYVDSQEPITLPDSEPEPDVVIVRGTTRDYQESHPEAPDVVVVIEVSDSTLDKDRGVKKRSYARAGIPIYWIINLIDETCEVYTNPNQSFPDPESDYQNCQIYNAINEVPVIIDDQEIGRLNLQALLP